MIAGNDLERGPPVGKCCVGGKGFYSHSTINGYRGIENYGNELILVAAIGVIVPNRILINFNHI